MRGLLLLLVGLPLFVSAADGGVAADLDGGADAGRPPRPQRWRWTHADGGWLDEDAGLTDVLVVPVGVTARVHFPLPIVLMQCDEPLLELDATEDALLLTGVDAGRTDCGFWFYEQGWPHRYMDVTVTRGRGTSSSPSRRE